jgi:DNA polymerase-3 subunit epsilon
MMPDLFTPEPWHERPFGALDFETTGVDPFTSRPVSFAYAIVDAQGKVDASLSEIINCDIEIPVEATAVHGITAERCKQDGVTPGWAVQQISDAIYNANREKIPVCIMNARFDWPLLLEEGKRHGLYITGVDLLDPGLLDKGVDKYRRGKRRLTDLCTHYGVELDEAHTAVADAIATAKLTRVIIAKHPQLQRMTLSSIARWQANVFEEFRRFLCSDGTRKIAKGWPIPERVVEATA